LARQSGQECFAVTADNMKILHVIESLGRAGAEQALVNLLPEMQRRGHTCEVAVLWPPYDLQPDLEAAGIKVHRLHGRFERRWNIMRGATRLARLQRRRRFDILHAHLLFADFYTGFSRGLAPQPRRVVTFHNTDFDFLTGASPTSRVARMALPHLLRRGFDGFSAVSNPVREHYLQHVPGIEIEFIPNAFPAELAPDANLDRISVRRQWQIEDDEFAIAVVARLAPEKGHQYLLEALTNLRSRQLRPKVLLLGDGPLREELQRQVQEKQLTSQVVFAGNRPHAQLLPLLQSVDAFVLPSTLEGFPLAPAEAMALQCPVLTTTAGGLTDLIENKVSGLLIPTADVPALEQGIQRLMQNAELRTQLGQGGRQRILKYFGAATIAARWETFYQNLSNT
jgi:glycosyltransferase involved in cell wall biosynthesis